MAGARIQVLYGYAANGTLRPQSRLRNEPAHFGWRLIGGNNRELARGAQSYATYTETCEAVQVLRGGLDALDWCLRNDARTGKWHWQAESAGAAVMTGGRSYERERDCRDSIGHVRVALIDAAITPGVTVLRPNDGPSIVRPMVHRRPIVSDAS